MVKDAVLITGCSAGGLGSGLALAFHEKNIHVFATARSLSRLSHLSSLPNVTCLEIDVTSQTSIARAVDAVQSKLEMIEGGGRLRYLVNNAGRGLVAPMLDFDEKDARDVFETNFWGGVSVLKAFVPLMLKGVAREGGKEKAVIVNVGSSAGVLNAPWNGIYAASKAAQNIMSETLRLELEPLGIDVLTILAAIVRTNFFSSLSSYTLPPHSLYASVAKEIQAVSRGEDTVKMKGVMGPEEFGRRVVKDVLGGSKGKTFTGTMGWAVEFMGFVPGWVWDAYFRKRGGLEKFVPVVTRS